VGTQSYQVANSPSVAPSVAGPAASRAERGNAFVQTQVTQQTSATGGPPQKVTSPLPVQQGEQRREVLGVEIVGRDVSPSALDACEQFVVASLSQRPDIQRRLRSEKVALVIVPRDKKMTDVAEFAGLRGKKTFDGRLWDDVRGSGGRRVAGGKWAIAVPEENLVAAGKDTYPDGYSVGLHEFAHTVHLKGLGSGDRRKLDELYAARKKAGGPWTEAYGASNAREYYAQCTNCYFGANAGVGANGADWLRTNDAPMFDFLGTVYGPPPRAEGNA
jgi:hypothetical protein